MAARLPADREALAEAIYAAESRQWGYPATAWSRLKSLEKTKYRTMADDLMAAGFGEVPKTALSVKNENKEASA